MEDYNVNDQVLTNNSLILLDRILVEHKRLQIERITDTLFCRTLDNLSDCIEKVKLLIQKNPRFDWVIIQEEIDRLYKLDKNLHGVRLILRWKPGTHFGNINFKIGKF